ncbi:S8/S53 family peptidase [Bacteroidota bacterium]
MKKSFVFFLLFVSFSSTVFSQYVAKDTYWFFFKEKYQNQHSIYNPSSFLSERSIERRAWQGIPVDITDLPVNQAYIDSLKSMGVEIKHTSKWLNGVLIECPDSLLLANVKQLSFLDTIPWNPLRDEVYYPVINSIQRFPEPLEIPPDFVYGYARDQVYQLNLQNLHEKGYTGKGVYICILDGGFKNLPVLPAFQKPISNDQILAGRNYVHKEIEVYSSITHGTHVASIIVGDLQDSLIGTAPDATIILALTENAVSETRIEEYAWIEAVEWADSLGADVLNTSLGYTWFDDPVPDYTYKDMDGKTAHISAVNGMCASKGMISVTSAGNSGNDSWYYIGAPADAIDILSVGAVDKYGEIAFFSSRGPSYDHRIKPEVSAMGYLTAYQATDSLIKRGNGTSYSSPVIAGATAVLWQAYPHLSAKELMRYILESSDRYGVPDNNYGYGIPNFLKSYYKITSVKTAVEPNMLNIYPNPFTDYIHIESPALHQSEVGLQLYDMSGRLIHSDRASLPARIQLPVSIQPGIYLVRIVSNNREYISRIVKVND